MIRRLALCEAVLLLSASLLFAASAPAQEKPARRENRKGAGDWPAYGHDAGGTRYSPLALINRSNVARLKVAWTYRTGEADSKSDLRRKSAFEATPILIDGVLYLSTPFNRVIALDPSTGAEKWIYDPQVDLSKTYSEVTSRGVSTWLDRSGRLGRRIFIGTLDARLIALDAATGKPCEGFGEKGQVDLTTDVRLKERGQYQVTSPPAVVGDLIVVGSSIGDNRSVDVERGVVRAYDARTGRLRWSWDPIPGLAGDPARKTWKGESADRTGAANAWSLISTDEERGLVFVPTSSPSPDFYGGERHGDNSYANSVVALRASTGEVVWHFQVVHHDLWDYDVAAQPVLVRLERGNRSIPAVVAATKMGFLFVLHRETGKPLFPVEERPVPASDVVGEQASATQPFPRLPGALVPQRLTPGDAWGMTPADRQACSDLIKSSRSEGIYTPPSLKGTIIFPGNVGGVNWGSVAYDPANSLLFAATNRLATLVKLMPREEYARIRSSGEGNRLQGEFGTQSGTPYVVYREPLRAPSGAPCNAPPWGALSAVNLKTGAVKWEVPLGSIPVLGMVPQSAGWGSINLGGPIATGGGLVFIAASMDTYLRAFDSRTGKELWKAQLPASAQATPMTYRAGNKQFVVVSAGGHGKLGTKMGDSVVAFALPAP